MLCGCSVKGALCGQRRLPLLCLLWTLLGASLAVTVSPATTACGAGQCQVTSLPGGASCGQGACCFDCASPLCTGAPSCVRRPPSSSQPQHQESQQLAASHSCSDTEYNTGWSCRAKVGYNQDCTEDYMCLSGDCSNCAIFCNDTCEYSQKGGLCYGTRDCESGTLTCVGTRCCTSSYASYCTACSSTGRCATCDSTAYMSSGKCYKLKSAGTSCSSGSHCASDSCKGGWCCSSTNAASTSACTQCSSSQGSCSACKSGYTLASGRCYAADGTVCATNKDCFSGRCSGERCCDSSVGSACVSCLSSGECSACSDGYFVSSGKCQAQYAAGTVCSDDAMCTSGACRSSRCCSTSAASACTACDATGACVSTQPTHSGTTTGGGGGGASGGGGSGGTATAPTPGPTPDSDSGTTFLIIIFAGAGVLMLVTIVVASRFVNLHRCLPCGRKAPGRTASKRASCTVHKNPLDNGKPGPTAAGVGANVELVTAAAVPVAVSIGAPVKVPASVPVATAMPVSSAPPATALAPLVAVVAPAAQPVPRSSRAAAVARAHGQHRVSVARAVVAPTMPPSQAADLKC